ncbi:hypothetical protein V8F06_013978 [Rhypophila decipiens]
MPRLLFLYHDPVNQIHPLLDPMQTNTTFAPSATENTKAPRCPRFLLGGQKMKRDATGMKVVELNNAMLKSKSKYDSFAEEYDVSRRGWARRAWGSFNNLMDQRTRLAFRHPATLAPGKCDAQKRIR